MSKVKCPKCQKTKRCGDHITQIIPVHNTAMKAMMPLKHPTTAPLKHHYLCTRCNTLFKHTPKLSHKEALRNLHSLVRNWVKNPSYPVPTTVRNALKDAEKSLEE